MSHLIIQSIIKKENAYDNFYNISHDQDDKIYACVKSLNLYNENSPYFYEQLSIIGMSKENTIFKDINGIKKSVIFSLILTTIVCILTAALGGYKVTKPIRILAEKVKKSDPTETLALEKINISEIDDLSLAIENLSHKVADSSSKLTQIIELLNMPIGAFEYKIDENFVYCTEAFFYVLGVDNLKREATYFDKSFFSEIMIEATKNPEPSMKGIYKIDKSNGDTLWIKLKMHKEKFRTLGVIIDVTQDVLEKQKIEYERDYDVLTDLLNRRAFNKSVIEKLSKGNLGIGAFIMWDLDNLKYVNDTYGHDYGDKYIKKASVKLKEFEIYDGIVARRSGDEFLVFISGYKEKNEIRTIIKNIHENIENTVIKLPNNRDLKLRVSTGIAWFPDDATTFDKLAKYSDFAMYKIKKTVKGSISEFSHKEYKEDSFLLNSQEDLNKLLDEELVEYAFQPIVRADNGQIFAYEALMRSKLDALKSPLQIIKLATADSRLYEIEKLTFFKSLECFINNKKQFGNAKLFINSIPNYILLNEDLKVFEKMYGQYLNNLVIEILENEQSDGQCTAKKTSLVSKWNGKIAIDDFGSVYNNEAVLLNLTPDFVKIDMEIVRGIHKDVNRQQISKNLISYATQRNIKTVAEGVEYKEELEKLIELGVDYVQGYYLSKPKLSPPKLSEEKIKNILEINYKLKE